MAINADCGQGRYRSVGWSFCILPNVPQPTSADFIPQITFRISANYQRPPHWRCAVAAVHPEKMCSRPAHHIPGSGLPVQHPNHQQYLQPLDSWCLPILILFLVLYRVGQKSKLLHFVHIFTKYWSIFTIFSPVDCVKNLLLSGMHTTLLMSLHYPVDQLLTTEDKRKSEKEIYLKFPHTHLPLHRMFNLNVVNKKKLSNSAG